MKRILVTTDFSKNSESAIRFAIHWARKDNIELEFLNVMHAVRELEWSDEDYLHFIKNETRKSKEKLQELVVSIFDDENFLPENYIYTVLPGITADNAILEYCEEHPGVDYICISTRGAGGLKKLLGTNTGNLITKSQIPVIALPSEYHDDEFNNILFASDLSNYDEEIGKVIEFATPLQAAIDVLHFYWPNEAVVGETLKDDIYGVDYAHGFNLKFVPHNVSNALSENIMQYITDNPPSMVVMFTNKEKNFWQKLFNPSKTEKISFEIKVPLLVFKK